MCSSYNEIWNLWKTEIGKSNTEICVIYTKQCSSWNLDFLVKWWGIIMKSVFKKLLIKILICWDSDRPWQFFYIFYSFKQNTDTIQGTISYKFKGVNCNLTHWKKRRQRMQYLQHYFVSFAVPLTTNSTNSFSHLRLLVSFHRHMVSSVVIFQFLMNFQCWVKLLLIICEFSVLNEFTVSS